MVVNHTDSLQNKKSVTISRSCFLGFGFSRMENPINVLLLGRCFQTKWETYVLCLDQGHSFEHLPSTTVRGVTLLSATDIGSSSAPSLLSVHRNTLSNTIQQHSTEPFKQRLTVTVHTLITSSLSERGACRLRFVPDMRPQAEEHKRPKRDKEIVKSSNLPNISRLARTVWDFFN